MYDCFEELCVIDRYHLWCPSSRVPSMVKVWNFCMLLKVLEFWKFLNFGCLQTIVIWSGIPKTKCFWPCCFMCLPCIICVLQLYSLFSSKLFLPFPKMAILVFLGVVKVLHFRAGPCKQLFRLHEVAVKMARDLVPGKPTTGSSWCMRQGHFCQSWRVLKYLSYKGEGCLWFHISSAPTQLCEFIWQGVWGIETITEVFT